jgi:hypothetical protein
LPQAAHGKEGAPHTRSGPRLRPPEAILLFSLPLVRNLARWLVVHSDALDRRLYTWQVGRFISEITKRVLELASSHDLQVEVKRLGDVGEVLVLTATRQVDPPTKRLAATRRRPRTARIGRRSCARVRRR